MISAIPAEDRPTIIFQDPKQVPVIISITVRAEDPADVARRIRVLFGPLTCLSCGARTSAAGELPCGH